MLEKGIWIAVICAWIRTHGIFNLYNLFFTGFMSWNILWIFSCLCQLYFSSSLYVFTPKELSPVRGKLREMSQLCWRPSLEGSVELWDYWDWLLQETFHEQLNYCSQPSIQFFFWGGLCPKGAENSNLENKGTAIVTGPLSASALLFLTCCFSFTKSILSHCPSDDNF